MGVDIELLCDQQRLRPDASEVERLWADNSKARIAFGWEPNYAGLAGFQRGLGETVDWFKQPAHLSMYRSDTYNL
jgi:nucleoside-diphosphate-sugar epimerase